MYHRFLQTAWLAPKESSINEYPTSRQYVLVSQPPGRIPVPGLGDLLTGT